MKVTAKLIDSVVHADAALLQPVSATADFVNTVRISTAEDYTGDYEVTSFCAEPLLTTSLILPTRDTHMLKDVTIYSIPTREEPNEAGGVTFIIGG